MRYVTRAWYVFIDRAPRGVDDRSTGFIWRGRRQQGKSQEKGVRYMKLAISSTMTPFFIEMQNEEEDK